MTKSSLLTENLDLFFESSIGLQNLRELILNLAFRGRFTSSPLRNTSKNGTDISKLAIPQDWRWVKLGEVAEYNTRPKVESKNIPESSWLLELEDLEKDSSRIIQRLTYKDRLSKSTKTKFKSGDVLYGKLRPYLNKVVVADSDGFCTTEIAPLIPNKNLDPHYLKYALKRPEFLGYVNSKMYGMKMPRLGTDDAKNASLPLPPLEEQKRIVAKVDQLMALCDELEEKQKNRNDTQKRLNGSAWTCLPNATDPGTFADQQRFVLNNFDLLNSDGGKVQNLRKAIFALGVKGKLGTGNMSDDHASDLVGMLGKKRVKLCGKKSDLLSITPEEKFFPVPENWQWVRLKELGRFCGGGTPSKLRATFWDGNINWVSPKDMKMAKIRDTELKITPEGLEKSRLTRIPKGSILIVARSGILKRCLPVAINDVECTVNQDLKVIIPFAEEMADYIRLTLLGFEDFILETLVKGGMTVQSLKYKEFENQAFPLPPLHEQKRIVKKVDQLISLCDDLEKRLDHHQSLSENLASSLVHNALTAA